MIVTDYLPRTVDAELTVRLRSAGAVLLEGPKACGKTWAAQRQARSALHLDRNPQARRTGATDVDLLLEGAAPRLIDEWQLVPETWNAVRAAVDDRNADGQFILTGSATPADDVTRHSGAMRIARIRVHPMSLAESGDSTNEVSFAALLAGEVPRTLGPDLGLKRVAELVCRGGWPSNVRRDLDSAQTANADYLRTVASADIQTVDGVRRDPNRVAALIFALARSSASYVSKKTLQADTVGYGGPLSPNALDSYLDALVRLWVAVPQPAWGEHLRSAAQVRKTPKWHLADPSLAAAALGATPRSLVEDPEAFGQVFETLAFRDLQVYAQAAGWQVRAYQDSKGDEIDIVAVSGGRWAGFEVKLSSSPRVVDDAAAKLMRIASNMRTAPESLTILTATGPSYRREDGVNVVSTLTLGP